MALDSIYKDFRADALETKRWKRQIHMKPNTFFVGQKQLGLRKAIVWTRSEP